MPRILSLLPLSAAVLAFVATGQSTARLSVQPGTETLPAADGSRAAVADHVR